MKMQMRFLLWNCIYSLVSCRIDLSRCTWRLTHLFISLNFKIEFINLFSFCFCSFFYNFLIYDLILNTFLNFAKYSLILCTNVVSVQNKIDHFQIVAHISKPKKKHQQQGKRINEKWNWLQFIPWYAMGCIDCESFKSKIKN